MEKTPQVGALSATHLAIIWLLRFHQIAVEPERLMHEVCGASNPMALLRFIRKSGLKAKAVRVPVDRLARTPMPAVLCCAMVPSSSAASASTMCCLSIRQRCCRNSGRSKSSFASGPES